MTPRKSVCWFDDGKAGHARQVRALLRALDSRVPVNATRLAPWTAAAQARAWLGRGAPSEQPCLLIGAGHDTHLSLLAARRATGAPSVVLMRPSLPVSWFNLCVIPRHDAPPQRDNVMVTEGPLSPLEPARGRGEAGLILVGGPSKHYRWDSAYVWIQLRDLILTQPGKHWKLSTSRRTPEDFLRAAPREIQRHVRLHEFGSLPRAWLDENLPRADCCVVTPDSMSMVFDALTCGVPCALLDLKPAQQDRATQAIAELLDKRRVGRASALLAGTPLPVTEPLREAERVAGAIVERWFSCA